MEFLKTLAEHHQRNLEKVREWSQKATGALQEIKEGHFELLIDAGMADKYCWLDMLDMFFKPG